MDLVSRLIMGITGATLWVLGFTNILTDLEFSVWG